MSLLEDSQSTEVHGAPAASASGDRGGLRREFRDLLELAGPVVLAEVGWMSMGIVDTLMVGPLGPQAIGAVGLGSSLFAAVGVTGMGLLLGLDTLVSQAYGARRQDECHRWLFHGVALAFLLSVPLSLIVWLGTRSLGSLSLHPEVEPLAASYLMRVNASLLPLLLYAAFRRYLQAVGFAGAVMFALISANLVNAFFNWVLIFGTFGFPTLGTDGAAWATVFSRLYMAAVVFAAVIWHDARRRTGLWTTPRRIEGIRLRRLLALGGPAAGQLGLEIGVFSAAGAFAGQLSPVALAAHQIALNIAGFTFMVPLGVAAAGAVLVGRAVGRRNPAEAGRAGWMALGLGAAFMAIVAVILLAVPAGLIGLFTRDPTVIGLGVALLYIAAVFQLFDGVQVVATGVLRGLGDTRTPLISNLAGHWFIGLPFGWICCFVLGWGVVGLWTGLSIGLILCGIVLVVVWARAARRLPYEMHAPPASPPPSH